MSISETDIQTALHIEKAVKEFFDTSAESKVRAKELMTLFISKGIFTRNYQDGLPIREFLRHLDENNHLHLIPQIHFEQKAKNKNLYFIKNNNLA